MILALAIFYLTGVLATFTTGWLAWVVVRPPDDDTMTGFECARAIATISVGSWGAVVFLLLAILEGWRAP